MSTFKKLLIIISITSIFITSTFAASDDSLQKIKTKGTWVIGIDETFAPLGFRDKNGQIVGFEIDLAKEVGKRLEIKTIFQPCVWDSIFMELQNGNIDAIWNGVTINDERKAKALFSKPYMNNRIIIVVNQDSNINKLSDLNGKKIAAQAGAPAVDYVKNYKGNTGFNPSTLKELVQYPDNLTALFDLRKNGVDAVVVDETFADYYMTMQGVKFRKLTDFFAVEEDGIAFRKNDIAFRDAVQTALDSMIKDGTAAGISNKWFGRNIFAGVN